MGIDSRSRRALLFGFVVVPYPFLFVGIPFASTTTSTSFQATCILFSLSSFAALVCKEHVRLCCRSALFWNSVSVCVVSSAVCAPWPFFVALLVSVSAFQYLSCASLLDGDAGVWHAALTFTAAACAYWQWGDSSASSEEACRMKDRRRLLSSDSDTATDPGGDWLNLKEWAWAVIVIALMVFLIVGMCALRHVNCGTFVRLRQWRRSRRVHNHHEDFAGLVPVDAAPEIPNSAVVPTIIGVQRSADPGTLTLRQYLDTKSVHELTLLAAATCNSNAKIMLFVRNNLGRMTVVKSVAAIIAYGKLELSYMPLKKLREIALRMCLSEDKDVLKPIFDSMNPHRQLVRWIAEREVPKFTRPQGRGIDWLDVRLQLTMTFLDTANDMAMASGTTARTRSRALRATFVAQHHVDDLPPIQEEPDDFDNIQDRAQSSGATADQVAICCICCTIL